jgi:hypothetical protein
MDFLNLTSLLYVGFRLAPFILVSYFVISSIFNSDIRGLIFLGLLLLEVFIAIVVGNMFAGWATIGDDANRNGVCNGLNLTPTGPLSRVVPLNLNVFAFTFGYLAQIIEENKLIMTNIPTVVIFSLIILYHMYWLYANMCSKPAFIFMSLALGFGFGWLFAFVIGKTGLVELQYFNGLKNQEVCKKVSKQKFKCSTKNVM